MRLSRLALPLALACAACGRNAPAGGPPCPHDAEADRRVGFRVVVSSVPTAIRRDLDLATLAQLRGTGSPGDGKLQGLTVVGHRLDYKTGIALSRRPFASRSCAWIETLTVDLTPGEVVIYIPKDYGPDTCESDEILRHERLHEETHRRLLDEAAERERRALSKADWLPSRGAPLAVADRAEAKRRLERMVDKIVGPVYEDFKAELDKEQAVIDLPENYRWTARRCSRWK